MPNGKSKGNAFERKICILLSRWWSKGLLGHELEDCFWRTSSSGGRATQRSKSSKRTKGQYGDVCATDPLGQPLIDLFTIELKTGYAPHTFADILDKPPKSVKPVYQQWFEKAERDSKASGAFAWLLIVQRIRRLPIVFMPDRVEKKIPFYITDCVDISIDDEAITGFVISEFFELFPPKRVISYAKKYERGSL